jgi:hypothetical protein
MAHGGDGVEPAVNAPVRAIARRTQELPAQPSDPHLLPPRPLRGEGLVMESQLYLGARPELHLSWAIIPSYRRTGCKLWVFHSTTSFSSAEDPDDLERHGRLIIETKQDGHQTLYLAEGDHFFTALLAKKGFIRALWNHRSELDFPTFRGRSVTVVMRQPRTIRG